ADVSQVLQSVLTGAGLSIDPAAVSGAASLIAEVNQHIDAIPATNDAGFLVQVVQAQVVAEGIVAPQLAQVAAGQANIDTVVQNNSGTALQSEIQAAQVQNLIPAPTLSISS